MQTWGDGCGLHASTSCGLYGETSGGCGLNGTVSAFTQCPELERRINEVDERCKKNTENIGDLNDLETADKSNIVAAINDSLRHTDGNYIYEQSSAQDTWLITHNLGKMPSITVIDSGGTVVQGEYEMIDENTVKCTFSAPFAGKAILN